MGPSDGRDRARRFCNWSGAPNGPAQGGNRSLHSVDLLQGTFREVLPESSRSGVAVPADTAATPLLELSGRTSSRSRPAPESPPGPHQPPIAGTPRSMPTIGQADFAAPATRSLFLTGGHVVNHEIERDTVGRRTASGKLRHFAIRRPRDSYHEDSQRSRAFRAEAQRCASATNTCWRPRTTRTKCVSQGWRYTDVARLTTRRSLASSARTGSAESMFPNRSLLKNR